LIRRLVSKGYIRIRQLNKRKIRYLLTPRGFAEKMQKSVKYALKTINSIGFIKKKIIDIVIPLYEKGEKNFFVLGKSDFSMLIDIAFKDEGLKECHLEHIDDLCKEKIDGVLLICKEGVNVDQTIANHIVDFIGELANDNNFLESTKNGY
ncbi:MAG: hypothetical protein P9X22_07090, partial [Candidatus Zapsychrus exili]|nr:hypothetical protein [Candidatus Zapsychrus exili]